jgi:2-polyprenyl-6-methoxyphenol hydroxylase-like FAD-dependent oxidoreductase
VVTAFGCSSSAPVSPAWRRLARCTVGARRSRLSNVGDAAHATSPNMAQGAAMALEDALVLAERLDAAGSILDALAEYERRRRPRTDWVLRQTHRRDRMRTLVPAVRNLVLKGFGRRIFHANHRPLREPA